MINKSKILETKNLTIGYNKISLISNINIIANKGEFIALIGSNGSGKSTLLRILTRLQNKIDGEILYHNMNISDYSIKEFSKLVSFVSTEKIFASDLKVIDILSFGRYPYSNWLGSISKDDNEIINIVISKFYLTELKNRYYYNLSDGEKQKVMIARAFCQNTDIIFLDEPTAFLDIKNKIEIIFLLRELCRDFNKTIVMSSHDINIILKEADKVWLLDNNLITEGQPEDLILSGKIKDFYKNEKFQFINETGEISLIRKSENEINLIAEGDYYIWTKNALEKNNYKVLCNNNIVTMNTIKYNKEEKKWIIYYNNNEIVKVNKIIDLINYLEFLKQ